MQSKDCRLLASYEAYEEDQRVIEMSVGELGLSTSYRFTDIRRRLDRLWLVG